SDYQRL
nr:Chain B, Trans-Golgi network integral membrane protein TGN38 [Rattus norvegicus]